MDDPSIDILIDSDIQAYTARLPNRQHIHHAVTTTCTTGYAATYHADHTKPILCVRFAHDSEVHALNRQWRGKDAVTDVLSFPMQESPPFAANESLGDIIVAIPFVFQEATRLQLSDVSHMLHLIVHGTLHLLAYDHENDTEAAHMQALETDIMQQLSLHRPYRTGTEHV